MTNTKQNKADSRTGDLTNKLGVNLANSSMEVSEDERYNKDFIEAMCDILRFYISKEESHE